MESGILSDLKVVEYAHFISGPYCGKLMADLGAQVIKVEEPGFGDEARKAGPFPNDIPHPERSGLFLYLNTNKVGVTLGLRTSEGLKVFKELVKDADILVENNPAKVMTELGLDYESLHKVNPRLVVTSITPFGQTGPYRDYKATDLVSYQMGGLGYHTPGFVKWPDEEPPLKAAGHQADFLAGLTAAVASMHAIFARQATCQGQHVDVSEHEAVASIVFGNIARYFYGKQIPNRLARAPDMAAVVLPCKNGYFCIVAMEERQWQTWMEIMGNPDWATNELFKDRTSRATHWDTLEPLLREWTMQHTKEEICQLAQARRVPITPVNGVEEIVKSQQLVARDFFVEIEHTEAGKVAYPSLPYKFSETPVAIKRRAPLLGEHNEQVFCQLLGYMREDLAKMRRAAVI